MDINNKKLYIKTTLILSLIAGASGAIIGGVNYFTKPLIEENSIQQEKNGLKEIYKNSQFDEVSINTNEFEYIEKLYEVKKNESLTGRIYKTTGKNAYGQISILTGINIDFSIEKVVLITNTQTYASTVVDFINSTFNSGSEITDVDKIDVNCGATYGAKLIRSMLSEALKDFKRR